MTRKEIQDFQKFAAPLVFHVGASAPKEAVDVVARNLWAAMIFCPDVEEATWKTLEESIGLEKALIEAIQGCYHEQMKALVSEEELVAMRQKYQVESEG